MKTLTLLAAGLLLATLAPLAAADEGPNCTWPYYLPQSVPVTYGPYTVTVVFVSSSPFCGAMVTCDGVPHTRCLDFPVPP